MTYGPNLKWRFPFQENIELRRPGFRVVFVTLVVAAAVILLISLSYYSISPFPSGWERFSRLSVENTARDPFTRTESWDDAGSLKEDTLKLKVFSGTVSKEAYILSTIRTAISSDGARVKSHGSELRNDEVDIETKFPEKSNLGIVIGVDRTVHENEFNGDGEKDSQFKKKIENAIDGQFDDDAENKTDEYESYEDDESYEEDEAEDLDEYTGEDVSMRTNQNNDTSGVETARTSGFFWNDTRLDILHMKSPDFDQRFQNPCWYEALTSPQPYDNNSYIPFSPAAKRVLAKLTERWTREFELREHPKRLRCLPYFLIIGQPKCGTTSLFWKIAKHPDIEAPPIKELHWWSRSRQGRRFGYTRIIPFEDYVDMFDSAAVSIERRLRNISTSVKDAHNLMTQKITGEASVSMFWDNQEWMRFPENRDQIEPLYIVPHYVRHMIPDVKLILMLRDPIERMFSDYLYFHSTNKSAEDFHRAVADAVSLYSNCTAMFSVRRCVYDSGLANKVRVRLRVGMYSVYMKDWLTLFPKEQFYVLRLEDYSQNPLKYVEEIYKFLHVRTITEEEEVLVTDSVVSNSRKPEDRELGEMLPVTRKLLDQFYRPYNLELAQMLGNPKFLWKDVH